MLSSFFIGFFVTLIIASFFVLLVKEKKTIIVYVIGLSILSGLFYSTVFLTPINFSYWLFWIWVVIIFVILSFIYPFLEDSEDEVAKLLKSFLSISAFILLLLFITTSSLFNTNSVSKLIEFDKSNKSIFKQIHPEKVRLVPKETAIVIASKTLGSYQKEGVVLGSQLSVDKEHTTIQKIKDSLYWVVPLSYKGIFKQFSFGDIPGYIIVDAYDPTKNAKLLGGKKIKYSLDAYFDRWAVREMFLSDVTSILDDFSFEVDDKFDPYAVATVLEPQVGFGKLMPVGVKIMNLQTGEINFYPMDKIPHWVDRVVPESIIAERIDEKGKWHNGVIAALFTGNGTWQLTNYGGGREMFFVEDGSGNTYWVSGVKSSGSDNSIIALVVVNTRTNKSYWIPMSGPTEKAVKDIVESSLGVNKSVWSAKLPILYNLYGKLVWVSVVVDSLKAYPVRYALVDANNISHYVVEKEFNDAIAKFFKKNIIPDIKLNRFNYKGPITRYNIASSNVYIWASGKIWLCSVKSIPMCSIIQKGDIVELSGFEKGGIITIDKFKNLNLE